jgi:hypothetical protein
MVVAVVSGWSSWCRRPGLVVSWWPSFPVPLLVVVAVVAVVVPS